MANTVLHLSQVTDENSNIVEGSVNINVPLDVIVEDIEIIFPNNSSKILNKKMLTDNTIVSSDLIATPTILTPVNLSMNFEGTFIVTPYKSTSVYDGLQTGILLEISTQSNFETIYKSFEISEAINTIDVDYLPEDTTYYARVRYFSNDYASNFSETVMFTTINSYTLKPKILFPTINGIDVSRTPMVQIGDYNYIGGMNTHESTEWEIATDELFTNIVRSGSITVTETVNGRSFIVGEALDENKNYYIRARYIGVIYGDSQWSNIVTFKTLNVEEKIVSFYQNNETYSEEDFLSFIKDGENYVIVGEMGQNGAGLSDFGTVTILDKNLNIIKSRKITVDGNVAVPSQMLHTIKMDSDGNYIILGLHQLKSLIFRPNGSTYTAGGVHPASIILKLNKNLDVLVSKVAAWTYTDQMMFLRRDFDCKEDGYYFIAETLRNNTLAGEQRISGIFKVDKNLNFVSFKIFNTSAKLIPTPYYNQDGYVILNELADNQFGSNTRPAILKLNNDYTVNKIIRIQPGTAYNNVIVLSNKYDSSKNLLVLLRIKNITTGKDDMLLLKFDTNLTLVSSKIFNLTSGLWLSDIIIDSNDDMYLLGKLGTNLNHVGAATKAIVIKLDKNFNIKNNIILGNSYWSHFEFGNLENEILTIIGFFTYGDKLHEASIIQLNSILTKNTSSTTTYNMSIEKLTNLTISDFTITVTTDTIPNLIDYATLINGTTLGIDYRNISITNNVDLPLVKKIDLL